MSFSNKEKELINRSYPLMQRYNVAEIIEGGNQNLTDEDVARLNKLCPLFKRSTVGAILGGEAGSRLSNEEITLLNKVAPLFKKFELGTKISELNNAFGGDMVQLLFNTGGFLNTPTGSDTATGFIPMSTDDNHFQIFALQGTAYWGFYTTDMTTELGTVAALPEKGQGGGADGLKLSFGDSAAHSSVWQNFADESLNGLKTITWANDKGYMEFYYHKSAWENAFGGKSSAAASSTVPFFDEDGGVWLGDNVGDLDYLVVDRLGYVGAAGL